MDVLPTRDDVTLRLAYPSAFARQASVHFTPPSSPLVPQSVKSSPELPNDTVGGPSLDTSWSLRSIPIFLEDDALAQPAPPPVAMERNHSESSTSTAEDGEEDDACSAWRRSIGSRRSKSTAGTSVEELTAKERRESVFTISAYLSSADDLPRSSTKPTLLTQYRSTPNFAGPPHRPRAVPVQSFPEPEFTTTLTGLSRHPSGDPPTLIPVPAARRRRAHTTTTTTPPKLPPTALSLRAPRTSDGPLLGRFLTPGPSPTSPGPFSEGMYSDGGFFAGHSSAEQFPLGGIPEAPGTLAGRATPTVQLRIDQEGFRAIKPLMHFVRYSRTSRIHDASPSRPSSRSGGADQSPSPDHRSNPGLLEFVMREKEASAFHHSAFEASPSLRRITLSTDPSRDLITRQASLSIKHPGAYSVKGLEDKGRLGWRFDYRVEDRVRPDGLVIAGEKLIIPLRFSCSPDLLNPSRGKTNKFLHSLRKTLTPKLPAEQLQPPSLLSTPTSTPASSPSRSVATPPSSLSPLTRKFTASRRSHTADGVQCLWKAPSAGELEISRPIRTNAEVDAYLALRRAPLPPRTSSRPGTTAPETGILFKPLPVPPVRPTTAGGAVVGKASLAAARKPSTTRMAATPRGDKRAATADVPRSAMFI